jgi:murein DD-endopeptidase MepM/ murein hydrolase activator NlpD
MLSSLLLTACQSTSRRDGHDELSLTDALRWPLKGRISSTYGPRWGRFHRGIDIAGRRGQTVRAAAGGLVSFAGRLRGYGKLVVLTHRGYRTYYAHLSRIKVRRGHWLPAGTPVGTVGATGNATGPHLHFEIRLAGGRSTDPLTWLGRRRLPGDLASR